jgi:hypothetical protein
MRPASNLAAIVTAGALATLIAACGGSSSGAATADTGPTNGPTEEADGGESAADGGGTVQAVTILDALYMTGSAHVEVSGGKQATFDGQLVAGVSMTTEGTTLLLFSAGEGENASVFSIANGADTGIGYTLTAPGIFTGGDGTTGCPIELTKNDDAGIEGRMQCGGQQNVGLDQALLDISATFSAAR